MAKLVVPGGNGFIGSEICRLAVQNEHEVAAFGRTGRPNLSPVQHPWISSVEWRAADVFDPTTWRDLLEGADAVAHCIATIRQGPDSDGSFDRMNAESAILAAQEAADADVEAFVFLSARDKPPLVSGRFIAAKRRAEREIPEQHPALRFVSLRPNLVYGRRRPGTGSVGALLDRIPNKAPHGYTTHDGRSLPVELVAAAALHAATTPTLEGLLDVNQIADVGRTSGLVDPEDVSDASLTPLLVGAGATAVGTWLLQRLVRGE